MRSLQLLLLALVAGLGVTAAPHAAAQTQCTGLCLQQVTCPVGQTTSISGIVYAPNGTDPLPNVSVYVPNAAVDPFTPGVSCPVVGAAPSGSPLVGAVTAVDGSFILANMPVGQAIPLVIVTGRWRIQTTVNTTSCANTPLPATQTHLPQDQTQGDIPKFAIATGGADTVECVLRKVGIADSEFTNPGGSGRINVYQSPRQNGPGALIDSATPSADLLMADSATLNSYDVLMLPCQGGPFAKPVPQLNNLVAFANAGGRVYSSHFSYEWMFNNPPFDKVVAWSPQRAASISPDPGTAIVNTGFSDGLTLATWLEEVGASTTPGQISVSTLRQDFTAVNPPTQTWLTLSNANYKNPVMQFVFDTPVAAATNQCGRVLFNEYHVENPPPGISPANKVFPAECATTTSLTPQEKLLEFSLFELTNDGAAATLTPASADFGTQPIGFATAPQTFTWTNNSTFTAAVTVLTASGDFSVISANCSSVAPGASCQIQVVFNPTVIGPRTGTLTVGSSGSTLLAQLTGIGIPDLSLSFASLTFPSIDVGASSTQSLVVTNSATGAVPVPALVTTGDFSVKTNCGNALAALSSCVVNVIFTPTTIGPRTGTLGVNSSLAAYTGATTALSGNGIDFTLVDAPTAGTTIAGYGTSFLVTSTPLAGFAAPITISCTTDAPASTCIPSAAGVTLSDVTMTKVVISTTSEYTVIGYGGLGGQQTTLWLIGMSSGALLLWSRRRNLRGGVRGILLLAMVAAASVSLSACSGKLPAKNPSYTPATGSSGAHNGGYTYTITESDGFLVHSATYSLNVTVK